MQQQQFHTPGDDSLSTEDAIVLIQAISTLSTALAARTIFNNPKLRSSLGNLFAAKFVEVSRFDALGSGSGFSNLPAVQQDGSTRSTAAASAAAAAGPAQGMQMLHSSIRSLLPAQRRKQRHPMRPETTWLSMSDDDDAVPHSMSSGSPGVVAAAAAAADTPHAAQRRHSDAASLHEAGQAQTSLLRTASASSSSTAGLQQHNRPAGGMPRASHAAAATTGDRNAIVLMSEVHGASGPRSDESPLLLHSRFARVPSPGACSAAVAGAHCAVGGGDGARLSKKSITAAADALDSQACSRSRAFDELAAMSAAAACSPGESAGSAAEGFGAAAGSSGGGGVPLVCELCCRRFSKQSALMQHRRWHTGEKPVQPYSCEQCGRGFSSRNSLHIHRAIHSGEKRYVCEVCGKRFSTQTYLWHHRAVHSDARPYTCEYCACNFKMRSSLNNHLARRHAVFSAPANGFQPALGGLTADVKPAGSPGGGGASTAMACDAPAIDQASERFAASPSGVATADATT